MKKLIAFLLVLSFMMAGCAQKIPKDALQLNPTSLADRQMQTRLFETTNYEVMLTAASAVFQDLGFNLDESERKLGVLVGSKTRSAVNSGQMIGAILLAALSGVSQPVDKEQIIRASLVMREINTKNASTILTNSNSIVLSSKSSSSIVHVTFQRIIINNHGQITLMEQINDPIVYRDFFEKLSKAVFLEAHEI